MDMDFKHDEEYKEAIAQAKANLEDAMARKDATFPTWNEVRNQLYTPEEIAESDLRVALIGEIIKARLEKNLSQQKLAELSGVKQPIIARMENGTVNTQINTILKLLVPLGKKLAIVPLNQE